jgi:hypothetical protein
LSGSPLRRVTYFLYLKCILKYWKIK